VIEAETSVLRHRCASKSPWCKSCVSERALIRLFFDTGIPHSQVTSLLPFPDPDVVARSLPDGSVLFHPRTEVYFGLNETGTVIWDALRSGASSEEALVDAIRARWPDARRSEVLAHVRELLADLSVEGLVQDSGEADTAA
jgi:hypothetical protein